MLHWREDIQDLPQMSLPAGVGSHAEGRRCPSDGLRCMSFLHEWQTLSAMLRVGTASQKGHSNGMSSGH